MSRSFILRNTYIDAPEGRVNKEPPAPTFTPRVLPLLSLVDASAVIFIVPLFVAMPPLLTTIAVLILWSESIFKWANINNTIING